MNEKINYNVKYLLRISIFLFVLIITTCTSFASEVDHLMQQGNNYYQKKEYQKAIDSYNNILSEGYTGTAVYYNLGNAYYREGKLGYAILNYQRALKLSPGDNDVQHNLALANSKTIDQINTLPSFFLFEWWESLLALFTITGWTYTAYIFYILLLISIGLYFFVKGPKYQRYSFFAGLISLSLLIITSALLIVKLNKELNIKNGVIVEQAVTVKQSPDPKSSDAFVIHEGLKVKIEDSVDNWYEIQLQDGKVGWMPKNDLRVI